MKRMELYLETSVWNFYYADDAPEKMKITREFFDNILDNPYDIYISETVLAEINRADEEKKRKLMDLIKEYLPAELEIDDETMQLAKSYISESIIPVRKFEDALHIAVSTVNELDALISWNCRHIVNLRKVEKINGLNLREGYRKRLEITTPMEVIEYEE